MGVRVLDTDGDGRTCLFCSTTGWAFGPLFDDAEEADAFLEWWGEHPWGDPRNAPDTLLSARVHEFRLSREAVKGGAS